MCLLLCRLLCLLLCLLLLRKELREQVCNAVHLLFELFAVVPELLIVVLEGLQLAVCLPSVVRRRRRKIQLTVYRRLWWKLSVFRFLQLL